jgi:hypothetical protein
MSGANTLKYDVENRLIWGQRGNQGYDPDNRRVYLSKWNYTREWVVTGEQVMYYGLGGQKMGTYTLSVSLSQQPATCCAA